MYWINKRKEDARKKGTVNNMSSTFLNQIGLGEFDMGYLLIGMGAVILLLIIFLILLIVQIRKTSKLKKRLDKFLSGKDGASLEKDIAGLYEDNKFLKANTEKNKKDIRTLYKNMESAYQKMGLVKYDAFNQMGGQLSFSLALLDENNNGFFINTVTIDGFNKSNSANWNEIFLQISIVIIFFGNMGNKPKILFDK